MMIFDEPIPLAFCFENNFGDKLNRVLFKELSSRTFCYISYNGPKNFPHLLGIGSILHHANAFSVVWGSGFIGKWMVLRAAPGEIAAVRGPLTRQKLREQRIECPEVYGDPAILTPLFYFPAIPKKYSWGVVPHYVDQECAVIKELKGKKDVLVLNVRDDVKKFIDELLSCEKIASSSLHGLVAADAYKIPSVWLSFSDKVVGGGFKFRDYLASVGRNQVDSVDIKDFIDFSALLLQLSSGEISLDLSLFIETCPVLTADQKITLCRKIKSL